MPATRSLLKKTLVITATVLVILAGLLVGGVRLLDTLAPQYRQALADRISQRIDGRVTVEGIELSWQWDGPVLRLADVSIRRSGETTPAIQLESIGLHFAFADIVHGGRLPDGLVLDTPRLAARINEAGELKLDHWSRTNDEPMDWAQFRRVRDMLRFVRIDNAQLQLSAPQLPNNTARIDDLDATIDASDDGGLNIDLSAQGPDWLQQFSATARIDGELPEVSDARFNIRTSGIDTLALAKARGAASDAIAQRLSGGRLAAHVQGHWRDRHLARATAELELDAIRDTERSSPLLPAVSATLGATGDPETPVRFALEDIQGAIDGLDALELSGTLDPEEPSIRVNARHLPGALALRLARLRFAQLDDTDVQAGIDNLSIIAGADTPAKVAFDFNDLEVSSPRFAFGPVAGRYYQQAGTHVLQFDGAGGMLTADRYVRGELAIDDLGGQLTWHRDANGLRLDARDLRLAANKASATANGHVRIPDNGAPVVDIRADLAAPDVTRVLQHIPQAPDLPNPRLRDWLPDAIKSGRLDRGQLEIAGPMDRFPFAKARAGERFRLELEGRDVDVAYKPGWPRLNKARGKLTLNGDNLRVAIADAAMLGVDLAASVGTVANVREPILQLDGQVNNGPAGKMLTFLEQSPLRDRFGKLVDVLDVEGPADLALDLRIPLKPGLGEPRVRGTVDAHGVSLNHDALAAPITAISGRVAFDGDGLTADALEGDLLGVDVHADLEPGPDKSQRILARATPTLPDDRAAIAKYVPNRWLDYGRGQTNVRIALQVGRDGKVARIDVDSDLQGVAIDLPAPLTKASDTAAPLSIEVQPEGHRLTLEYDNRLDLDARLTDGRPSRVQIHLNDATLRPPDTDGLWIGGRADAVDAPGWYDVVRHVLAQEADGGSSGDDDTLAFIGGNLTTDELRIGDRYFENAKIRAQPMTRESGWRIDFEGPDTQGQITWTENPGERRTFAGNLKRLALKTRAGNKTPDAGDDSDDSPVIWQGISPLELPALELYVADFSVDDTSFGETRLQAHALGDGWQLDRLSLQEGALSGNTSGQWTRRDGMTRANARTRLKGHGLARLLTTLGYPPTVQAEKTRIESMLTIGPNPNGLDLRALDGTLDLALDNGKLTSVEPGAARVLGLFNLYVLPRRLQLDFSDVVDDGLAFDKVRASFNIVDGNAYSDGTRIETPSSEIRISGRIGLAARDYDERVTIIPEVGSGVAIASTVFGGPLVGAAVFAVQELLKQPIQDASRISYTLKGSWDDPSIANPSAEK